MDAAILHALMAKAIRLEDELKLQAHLEQARDAITNMTNAPQDPSHQTAFAEALKKLKNSVHKMALGLTPAEWDRLRELHSARDFSSFLIDQIEDVVRENPATPAVIRDKIVEIANKRSEELEHYRSIAGELEYFGLSPEENDPDKGQIGFKVPRDIFSNNFGEMINELKFIQRFVRLISEAEGENPDDIEVGPISTTDPVFWLIVAFGVLKTVGEVSSWCLDTWKKVEDIRLARAQVAKLGSFDADEIEAIFGAKIQGQIDSAVDEKIGQLLIKVEDLARRNELENGIRPALKQFLARIERGMTVEIRYLPTYQEDLDEISAEDREKKQEEVRMVASTLVFPEPVGEPVLKIEAVSSEGEPKKAARAK